MKEGLWKWIRAGELICISERDLIDGVEKGRDKEKSQQYFLKLAKRTFINDFYVLVFGLCCQKAGVNILFQL